VAETNSFKSDFDKVKDSGKPVLFTLTGTAFDGYLVISDVFTDFNAAEGDNPAKVVLGTVAIAAPAEAASE